MSVLEDNRGSLISSKQIFYYCSEANSWKQKVQFDSKIVSHSAFDSSPKLFFDSFQWLARNINRNSYWKKRIRCRYMHPQTITYRICLIEFITNNTSAIIVDKNFRSIFNGNVDVEQRLNKISLSCFHYIYSSHTTRWLWSFAVFVVLNSIMYTVYCSLHSPPVLITADLFYWKFVFVRVFWSIDKSFIAV